MLVVAGYCWRSLTKYTQSPLPPIPPTNPHENRSHKPPESISDSHSEFDPGIYRASFRGALTSMPLPDRPRYPPHPSTMLSGFCSANCQMWWPRFPVGVLGVSRGRRDNRPQAGTELQNPGHCVYRPSFCRRENQQSIVSPRLAVRGSEVAIPLRHERGGVGCDCEGMSLPTSTVLAVAVLWCDMLGRTDGGTVLGCVDGINGRKRRTRTSVAKASQAKPKLRKHVSVFSPLPPLPSPLSPLPSSPCALPHRAPKSLRTTTPAHLPT